LSRLHSTRKSIKSLTIEAQREAKELEKDIDALLEKKLSDVEILLYFDEAHCFSQFMGVLMAGVTTTLSVLPGPSH
jgi:hypothetical protein